MSEFGTPEREAEIDRLLAEIRKTLLERDFRSISIHYDTAQTDNENTGFMEHSHTGSFTLRAMAV